MIARYTRPEMAALWSEERRLATWLEVELLLCEALASRGELPAAAAEHLFLFHVLSGLDVQRREVSVERLHAEAVVDDHAVAVNAELIGEQHLAAIAGEGGLDAAVTLRLLQSDADAEDIAARDADARAKGVTAVPTFLVAQRYVVTGAQPPDLWGKVIAELTKPEQPE